MPIILKHFKRIILSLFLPLMAIYGYANPSVFRGLSVAEGLSDLIVNAIYKDSIGYIWIGTSNTLERFDGSRLRHYPVPGTNEKLKRVNAIADTTGNEIWLGNGLGLWRVNSSDDG